MPAVSHEVGFVEMPVGLCRWGLKVFEEVCMLCMPRGIAQAIFKDGACDPRKV